MCLHLKSLSFFAGQIAAVTKFCLIEFSSPSNLSCTESKGHLGEDRYLNFASKSIQGRLGFPGPPDELSVIH